jgi:hypothetical protein
MSKATKAHTTPPAAPPPKPLDETWLRLLAPSFGSEESWAHRDPVSKAMFAVSGAADRIGGLAEICWSLNLCDMQMGGKWAGEAGLRHPYGFIARTLTDVAKGLRDAGKLYMAEGEREDAAALRSSKRGGQ